MPGSSVLDIGCGPGRDLNVLISRGYEAKGVDSCEGFVRSVSDGYPALEGLVSNEALPGLKRIRDQTTEYLNQRSSLTVDLHAHISRKNVLIIKKKSRKNLTGNH